MKKIIFVLLVLCSICTIPNAYADRIEGDYSIINNYTELLEWRDAGCPSSGSNQIVVIGDFGWPKETVEIDFGVKSNASTISVYRGNVWTIPENITLKNLNVSLTEGTTLTIEGKLINNLNYEQGNPMESLDVYKTTLNLGKNAQIKGALRLYEGTAMNCAGGHAEEVTITSAFSGSENQNPATISGNFKADKLVLHNNMSVNIAEGSTVEVGSIEGSSANTVHIEKDATLYYTSKYIDVGTNVNIKSGGVMTFLFNPPAFGTTFTIEEGGVCNTYQGAHVMPQNQNAKLKGKGTINLYGNHGFSYDGTEYYTNPNIKAPDTIPMLDATIVINEIKKCDHAGGKTYTFVTFIPNGETEPNWHIQMCSSCRMPVDGTQTPHTYTLEGTYDTFSRYRCVCGRSYTVERTSGICGDDISFSLEGDTLRLNGVGSITEFVPTRGTWEEKATTVKKVVIESGITTVGENAFSACSNIEQVEYSGNYAAWKMLDIKAGNDVLKCAKISLDDGSVILPTVEKYRTRADFVYKEESSTEQIKISLMMQNDDDKMTEDEIRKLTVMAVCFTTDGLLDDIKLLQPNLEEGLEGAQWIGDIPSGTYRVYIWNENNSPLTR